MATELWRRPELHLCVWLSLAVNTVLHPSGPHVWHWSYHKQMGYDVAVFTSCTGVLMDRAALNSQHFLLQGLTCVRWHCRNSFQNWQGDEACSLFLFFFFYWWKWSSWKQGLHGTIKLVMVYEERWAVFVNHVTVGHSLVYFRNVAPSLQSKASTRSLKSYSSIFTQH